MAKRGWPKGKPRKQPEKIQESKLIETQSQDNESGAFHPTIGIKREGGKAALMAENQEIALREENQDDKSERDKIEDRFEQKTYGTPEGEHSREEEAPPSSEGEHPQEESEAAPPKEEPEEEHGPEEEMVPKSEHKEAEDRMHQATTEAANYRKLMEEIAPFVDWGKYNQNRGKPSAEKSVEQPRVETPPQDLFVSDYNAWMQKLMENVATNLTTRFEQEYMPKVVAQSSEKAEWTRLEGQFTQEVGEMPGGSARWISVMNSYINEERKPGDTRPPKEIFNEAKKAFDKDFGHLKKPQKKVVPLESPGKKGEREKPTPEKPMDLKDWEKENRDFVKFRQKKVGELQGM